MDDSPKVKLILVGLHSLPHGGIQSYLGQLGSQLHAKGYRYCVLDIRTRRDVLYHHGGPIGIVQRMLKYLAMLFKLIDVELSIVFH